MNNGLKVPKNFQAVMPYLILKNAESFINFAVQVFDATVTLKEMRDSDSIMHAEISIGGSTVMMPDSNTDYEPQNAGLFVYAKDADAAFSARIGVRFRDDFRGFRQTLWPKWRNKGSIWKYLVDYFCALGARKGNTFHSAIEIQRIFIRHSRNEIY